MVVMLMMMMMMMESVGISEGPLVFCVWAGFRHHASALRHSVLARVRGCAVW